jgi:hypothetical protein
MLRHFRSALAVIAACLSAGTLRAQDPVPPPGARPPLRLFLDCPAWRCDPDFFRTEFAYVDFMRDPKDADVQVLVTEQETGGGGTEYTVTLLGRGRFEGRTDTLRAFTQADATDDDERKAIARPLGLGLARYVATGPLAERFTLRYEAPASQGAAVTQAERDPWNYWAFRLRFNTFLNGEAAYNSADLHSSFGASRITAQLKVEGEAWASTSRSEYELDDTTTILSTSESYGTSVFFAPSLGRHWGWAVYGEASRSTYQNEALDLEFLAGLEYDIWPYEEVTRRLFVLRAVSGVKHFRYDEITIYGETEETRPTASLESDLDVTQPWGSVGANLELSAYLHDLTKNRTEFRVNADIRLVRGLSLSVFGEVASIHDQLSLPAGGATDDEILLRQQQLATSYSYSTSVGLSYNFGSRFNNVVNPRFR